MALFIKILLENSLKSIHNIHKCIPNQKIEIPEINFFEHEFTFLSDAEIEIIYKLYSKILKLSYMQSNNEISNELVDKILKETLLDKDTFEYNKKIKKILNKANQFFNE